jgi:transcriptional regulator with XRE-family HTH domain
VWLTNEATVRERALFYRRRKGITQEVLAGLLGRSVEWLVQFERGVKELDRLSTIVAIADALGIEPAKLLPAAFTTRRRELRDAVIGTAPDCAAAIKAAMFRYNGSARRAGGADQRGVRLLADRALVTARFAASGLHRRCLAGRQHQHRRTTAPRIRATLLVWNHLRDARPDR